MKQIKTNLIALLLFITITAQAQEAITAVGGDNISSNGKIAYSVGQIAYTTNTNPTTGTVAQGVQQAYVIFTLGEGENELNTSLSAYPNPTIDVLNLKIANYNNEKLAYQLFDIQGKQILSDKITAKETQINTSILPTGTYFINVISQNKKIQSFKIIKN